MNRFLQISLLFCIGMATQVLADASRSLFIHENQTTISQTTASGTRQMQLDINYSAFQDENKQNVLKAGDQLRLELFNNPAETIVIDTVFNYLPGTWTLRGVNPDNDMSLFLLTFTGDQVTGLYQHPELEHQYRFHKNNTENICTVKEIAFADLDELPGAPSLLPPELSGNSPIDNINSIVRDSVTANKTIIDVMMAYTPAANAYANADNGGIQNMISQALSLSQTALDNSNIDITLNLVYSGKVDYVESGNSHTDLYRLVYYEGFDPYSGSDYQLYLEDVPELRNIYGADLVALITDCQDVGGVGFLLTNASGRPDYAYCIARVGQVSSSYTLVHEWGHNMGAHHRKDQTTEPGPGLYSYAAGWRWIGDDDQRYCSVMSYRDNWNLNPVYRVGYFSNPLISFKGQPTGHITDANNALCLNNTRQVVAAYRGEGGTVSPKITGYIRDSKGNPVENVRIDFTDNESIFTNTTGYYTKAVSENWSGNITPLMHNVIFDPQTRYVQNVNSVITDVNFTAYIQSGGLEITYPTGGEMWKTGDQRIITWRTMQADDRAYIYLINDSGYELLLKDNGTRNDGDFTWDIPGDTPPGDNYRIKIISSPSQTTAYSSGRVTIRERIIPEPPVLLYPADGETLADNMPTLDWQAQGLASYHLQVSRDDRFSDPDIDQAEWIASQYAVPASTLLPNKTYYWRVSSYLDGEIGEWSQTQTFQSGDHEPDKLFVNHLSSPAQIAYLTVGEYYYPDRNYSITLIPEALEGALWISPPNDSKHNSSENFLSFDLNKASTLYIAYDSRSTSLPNWMSDYEPCNFKVYVSDKFEFFDVYQKHFNSGSVTLGGNMAASADGASTQYLVLLQPDPPATLALTSPNGGESWIQGNTYPITWDFDGDTGDSLIIELLRNDQPYRELVTTELDAKSWDWTIDQDIEPDNKYRIRITAKDDNTIQDKSYGLFAIRIMPKITLTAPNGGETWFKGGEYSIEWQYDGNVGDSVSIDLIKDQTPWMHLASLPTDTESLQWQAPDTLTTAADYTIKISSTTEPSLSDFSDTPFTVTDQPQITVTSPNAYETWLRGYVYNITWSTLGETGQGVKILLLKNDIIIKTLTTYTANTGSWQWNITTDLSTGPGYIIRIVSTTDPSIYDDSDSPFSLQDNTQITVKTPNGGEVWLKDATYNISWQSGGNVGDSVSIKLLKAGQILHTLSPGTPNTGSWHWSPWPDLVNSSDYGIRITSLDDDNIWDESNAPFTIDDQPCLLVNTPNGGESWYKGYTYNVTWEEKGDCGNAVNIVLLKNDSFHRNLVRFAPNNGQWEWSISTGLTSGDDFRLKIVSTSDTLIQDLGDAEFSILDEPKLTLTAPNGGEFWLKGSEYNITWESVGAIGDSVTLDLLLNSDVNANIITSTANNGAFSWQVPNNIMPSSGYQIRVASKTDQAIADNSDNMFSIDDSPGITVTAPNGGETWYKDNTYTISWESTGDIGNAVNINMYVIGYYRSLAQNIPNTGQWQYTVPSDIYPTAGFRIQVASSADTSIFDMSDNTFNIMRPLPAAVDLLQPADNSSILDQTPDFAWSESNWATAYTLELSDMQDFSAMLFDTTLAETGLGLSHILNAGHYYWRVRTSNESGASNWSPVFSFTVETTGILAQKNAVIPQQYYLTQNYPNPFNPVTRIDFGLPKTGHTQVLIFNISGQIVKELVSRTMPAGSYTLSWDALNNPSGIYYISIQAGDFLDLKKMVLVK